MMVAWLLPPTARRRNVGVELLLVYVWCGWHSVGAAFVVGEARCTCVVDAGVAALLLCVARARCAVVLDGCVLVRGVACGCVASVARCVLSLSVVCGG